MPVLKCADVFFRNGFDRGGHSLRGMQAVCYFLHNMIAVGIGILFQFKGLLPTLADRIIVIDHPGRALFTARGPLALADCCS